ncbi:hypothetical protein PLACP1_15630 [Planifilum fimeticola]
MPKTLDAEKQTSLALQGRKAKLLEALLRRQAPAITNTTDSVELKIPAMEHLHLYLRGLPSSSMEVGARTSPASSTLKMFFPGVCAVPALDH